MWASKVYEHRCSKQKEIKCKEVSLDEMWTYVKCKRGKDKGIKWIWTCIADGKFLFEVGLRDKDTFIQFFEKIPEAELYYTDNFKIYDWLPADRHVKGIKAKSKTNRNEGIHSILRDKLARLKRKTKAYSKSISMLCGSIALLAIQNGWI